MQKEIFIISDKNTKEIEACGKVDKERDQEWINRGDISTTYGYIQDRLAADSNLQVLYLPLSNGLPNREIDKINSTNTKILSKTAKEKEIFYKKKEIAELIPIVTANARLNTLQAELEDLEV